MPRPISRPLYADMLGREISLAAVYDLARRITAKYGAAGYVLSRAIVPPQNLGPRGAVVRIQVVEGYVDQVIWPMEKLARYRDFFTDYTARIVADRPANIRTLERYLLLANDLPGLKFSTTLKPSATNPNASMLVVEVKEKTFDAIARIDNRGTIARGPVAVSRLADGEQHRGVARGVHRDLCGDVPARGTAIRRGELPAGAHQRRAHRLCQCELRRRPAGHRRAALLDYRTRSAFFEAGLAYPVIRSREKNLTLTGLGFVTNDDSFIVRASRSRATGCAASASRPMPTGPTASSASTRST